VTATFYDAGHILGSAVVELTIAEAGRTRRLVFTGDLGRRHLPILRDPETPPEADLLIIESTYGDRTHEPVEMIEDRLAAVINRVFTRKGKLLIPAFAVGRTQELVFTISRLLRAGRIPACCVYVDSPLAVDVTEIFNRHPEAYDREIRGILRRTGDPFGFELLEYVRSVEESKELNEKRGPFLVISASGMMEAGRILHHLRNGIDDPRNLILVVGYQAANTLGRRLVDGVKEVRIFGEPFEVKAEVVVMNEFSAHADKTELAEWVNGFRKKPETVFVVHGEESQSLVFAGWLQTEAGIPRVEIPRMHQEFER
jgi:metallo-beta-lactamase family protein